MKGQIVTPYRVSHLQRYGVSVGGNVTSVYALLAYNEDGNSLLFGNFGTFPVDTASCLRRP
jgi:hypothetical protein